MTDETKTVLAQIKETGIIPFAEKPTDPRFIDLTGRKFRQLTVLGFAGQKKWFCQCECGNITRVHAGQFRESLSTYGCGCKKLLGNQTRHGEARTKQVTPEYAAYFSAYDRCNNPKNAAYRHYGGRGIEFRFSSYDEFLAELGRKPTPKHSLDRINNNGHYEKGNVRWATWIEQSNNRRSNRYITLNNETKSFREWLHTYQRSEPTFRSRIRRGWCESCALTLELKQNCPHIDNEGE